MQQQRILYFAGPLANTGGSLRSVKLAPPFKIERWTYEKIAALIVEMQGPSEWQPDNRVDELQCIPAYGATGHVVTAKLDITTDDSESYIYLKIHKDLTEFEARLDEQIRLISVYFSAAVTLPVRYWFFLDKKGRHEMVSAREGLAMDGDRATPSYQESLRCNDFLLRHSFSDKHEYLKIALDHWSHSQDVIPRHMQLLSLITALEVLLNSAQTELKHRITRATAVLIGRTKEECLDIYSSLGKIYDVRSQIVHTGQLKTLRKVNFWQLRLWVSKAILTAIQLNLPKEQLCSALVELGFGDGPRLGQHSHPQFISSR